MKAIKLLSYEKELLTNMTKFFKDAVKHYATNVAQDGGNEEKNMLANATLMKNCGRTLWKVAEVLLSHKRQRDGPTGVVPVVGVSDEKDKLLTKVMKGRYALMEEQYAKHLTQAGVSFQGGGMPAKYLRARKPSVDVATVASDMSHAVSSQADSVVKITSDGDEGG